MLVKPRVSQRIQMGLILAMAFLLVLGSNRLDQRHFSTVQNTVNSVYEDRVVVQDLIYQINNTFQKKELRLALESDFKHTMSENQKVEQLLVDFGMTKLTQKESRILNELSRRFYELQNLENKLAKPTNALEADLDIIAIKKLDQMQQNLDALAKIQLSESEQLIKLSNKSLGMNILLSKLEVVFLILFGIAMLFLIFYPQKRVQASP